MSKIINVYYGADALPYKDKELTTHFPIIGGAFQGADNTTEIRFYVDELSANRQWAVFGKLPNGKKGFKVLTESVLDEDEDRYYPFLLSQFFTQYKGDLYLSLGGYYGNIVELNQEQEYELQQVSGEMTGAIKLNIAYSVQMEGSDYDELPQWLQALASKLDINKGIIVAPSIAYISTYIDDYENGQVFFAKNEQKLYYIDSGSLKLYSNNLGIIQTGGLYDGATLDKDIVNLPVCYIYHTNTGMIYRKISVSGGLVHFANEFSFMDGNDSQYDTLGRVTFDVNSSTGVISNSTIYTKQIYNKGQVDNQFYNKSQANDRFAKLGENNTFTGSNVFNDSPQTNESITDASSDTKLTTKKYVKDLMDEHLGDYKELYDEVNGSDDIVGIVEKIPSQASETNQLADRDWVNSTINSLASFYITKNAQGDPFATYSELANATTLYSGGQVRVPTRNDYCLVISDENHDNASCRYIYQGTQWEFQFVVNETPFTSDQIKAINSGITDTLVAQITTNANNITTINGKLPIIKDYVIPTTAWALVNGKYVAELDAGVDFVIDDNAMKVYTPTGNNDQLIRDTYGINVSSDATTQKFTFTCNIGNSAPTSVVNFTIAQFGGN